MKSEILDDAVKGDENQVELRRKAVVIVISVHHTKNIFHVHFTVMFTLC